MCSGCSPGASPTARSAPSCSSRPRPPACTSPTSSPSSPSPTAPKPPPSPTAKASSRPPPTPPRHTDHTVTTRIRPPGCRLTPLDVAGGQHPLPERARHEPAERPRRAPLEQLEAELPQPLPVPPRQRDQAAALLHVVGEAVDDVPAIDRRLTVPQQLRDGPPGGRRRLRRPQRPVRACQQGVIAV